jgi:hypothetical protein
MHFHRNSFLLQRINDLETLTELSPVGVLKRPDTRFQPTFLFEMNRTSLQNVSQV